MRKKLDKSLNDGPLAFFVQGLILLYMLALSLETVPSLREHESTFSLINNIVTVVFVAELILRLLVTEQPLKYLTSFYGVIDLVAILPTLVGIDSKSLRVLRLLRVFKLLKNKRINDAVERLQLSLYEIRDDLLVFTFISFIFMYFAAFGIYHFEHDAQPDKFGSVPTAFWWAVVTLTTVGYGDSYPITIGGKVFAGFVVLIGIGIVAIPAGLIASALTSVRRKEEKMK